jgi:putative ABC transport system permease protein
VSLLFSLALRNLFRNPTRTAVSLLVIAVGCSAIVINSGVVFNIFRELREDAIHGRYGHLQIYRRGYSEGHLGEPSRYLMTPDEAGRIVTIVSRDPRVLRVMRRREFSGLASNGSAQSPFIGIGVEAEDDAELSRHTDLVAGKRLSASDVDGAFLGKGLAEKLNAHLADSLTLLSTTSASQLNAVQVRVTGVFEGGLKEYDDWTMKVPLAVSQHMLLNDRTEQIVVLLASTADTGAVSDSFQQAFDRAGLDLEIRSWNQLALFHNQVVGLFGRELNVIASIVGCIVVLAIGNAVGMSIMERSVELATFRAIGIRPRVLVGLLVIESLLVGLIGAVTGTLLAICIAKVANMIGIPYPSPPGSTRPFRGGVDLSLSATYSALLLSVSASVVASLLPAWRVLRIPLAATLRRS